MTLNYFTDYSELFKGCVLYLDGTSPTVEVIGSHTITNTGSVAVTGTNRFGQVNKALSFNGTTQYLSLPHDATNLVFGTGNFMFSIWFNKIDGTLYRGLIVKGNDVLDYSPIFIGYDYVSMNRCVLYMSSTNSSWDVFQNAEISSVCIPNVWHNIMVWRIGTSFYSMFDGGNVVTLGTGKTQSFQDGNTNNWGIGGEGHGNNPAYRLYGSLGEVAIWKGTTPDPKTLYQLTSKKYLYPVQSGVRSCE